MHPVVRDEIYRIGYEAIRNAYTHAHATHLEIALSYGRDLTLRVADDGVGMEPPIAERGKEGHFGLPGMRERASRIGARLSVTSTPGAGTAIVVTVPGRAIFRRTSSIRFVGKLRSVFSGTEETEESPWITRCYYDSILINSTSNTSMPFGAPCAPA
jgi:Histidine kinase-, DNA gyrase B-, and HSP90-like ATPase